MMPLTSTWAGIFQGQEVITMDRKFEKATDAMIDSQAGTGGVVHGEAELTHKPTTAEVVYRIATMTAVIFLLATVI